MSLMVTRPGTAPQLRRLRLRVPRSRSRKRRGVILGRALKVLAAISVLAGPGPAWADLHFTEPVANAGVVYAGTRLVYEFTFENRGPETVAILEARASCGCLKPRFTQHAYRPGEKGTLMLEVNTLSQAPGPHTWTVGLNYQTGTTSREMPLRLSARLVSEVTVQPAALVVFADQIAKHEVVLTDLRAKPLSIVDVRASSPKLIPRVSQPCRDARGRPTRKIGLAVADDYPEGRHDEVLDIYTDDPRYRDLRVPVTVIKRAPRRFVATPSQVELVAPAGQPSPSRIVLIRDNEGQRVHIDQVLADDPAIACQWVQGPNVMATLRVRADRTLSPGESLRSAVHVRIDQPVRETLTIPVTCTAR